MEKLVSKLAVILTSPLQYDEEKRAVVQYGLFAIIQIVIVAIIISLFGALTGCFLECWIVYLTVAILRKSTGGAHARTINGCLLVSVIVIAILGLLSRYLYLMPYGFEICLFLCPFAFFTGCLIIYKFAPVGSKNKPLKSEKKIKRLRNQSFITLLFYAIITCLIVLYSLHNRHYIGFAVGITLSVLWQSITLLIAVANKNW